MGRRAGYGGGRHYSQIWEDMNEQNRTPAQKKEPRWVRVRVRVRESKAHFLEGPDWFVTLHCTVHCTGFVTLSLGSLRSFVRTRSLPTIVGMVNKWFVDDTFGHTVL